MLTIFVSYRRSDSEVDAGRLCDRLRSKFGNSIEIFKDVDSIGGGENFREVISRELDRTDCFIPLIGPDWLMVTGEDGKRRLEDPNDYVRFEIERAISLNKRTIPILVRSGTMPPKPQIPSSMERLADMLGLPLRPDPDFEHDFNRIVHNIRCTPSQQRILLDVRLSFKVEALTPDLLKSLQDTLREYCHDSQLLIEQVRPGSVHLQIDVSEEGGKKLERLIARGTLTELQGLKVQSIRNFSFGDTIFAKLVPVPEPGQLVTVRRRPFAVTDVRFNEITPSRVGDRSALVSLSSVEDDALGEELEVVWELEPGAEISEASSLPKVEKFDRPTELDAFIEAVRWGAISSADVKALQSPFRSGIDVEDYQLDPVVRALNMPRVNLLIADDVGLGKTIEAGLVAQELILRHRVRSILIICPSSIQIQWKEEMRDKFGLEFRIVDTELMKDLRRRRGIHVNPWTHFPRLITSIDFLKRERPMRLFRETLPAPGESTYPRRFDLLIVDEAHNIAPSGAGNYATESLRTLAIRTLSPHFEHKLFLSATPHNGYQESFTALLELLDNQRFARRVPPNRTQLASIMVRRLKSELGERWDGTPRFPKREVTPLEVTYTDEERELHRCLRKYASARKQNARSHRERFASEFVLKLLKKRLFSSPAAFASTLAKHRETVLAHETSSLDEGHLARQILWLDDDFDNDGDYESAQEEVIHEASKSQSPLSPDEQILLDRLTAYADCTGAGPDSKGKVLLDWLDREIRPGGEWSDKRVIIFTEFRTTQKWLLELLADHGFAADGRLLQIYGGLDLEERDGIKKAFQAHPADSKVRILLATDAAAEGINLQNHCSRLIHYEIPWNPNRMEQRNGRIDRHGQRDSVAWTYHFVGAGFELTGTVNRPGELEGDLEFLMRAVFKVDQIREDLGKVGPVIAQQVEDAMLGKRAVLDTTAAERENQAVKQMLRFERRLKEQLVKLAEQLHETRNDLHLTPETIENVVQTGLALAGQPTLVEGVIPDHHNHGATHRVWRVPALSGSWDVCLEGLPHPFKTDVLRPITFDHSVAQGRDDVVLAHLNHRLVQMCLRLLRAEIWTQGTASKLNRVTARVVPDSELKDPAVVVHGRLVVLGKDGHRLHEEVIHAGGSIQGGRFRRFNVGEARAAWEAGQAESVPPEVESRIKELWPRIEEQVIASLNVRMEERTKNLQTFLDEREDKDVRNVTAILTELEATIRRELEIEEDDQLTFEGWKDDEKAQFERDRSSLMNRLAQIPAELAAETAQIQARYAEPTPRLFPIAITFLVPPRAF